MADRSTIVTVRAGADAAAVQRELAARGLWVRRHDLIGLVGSGGRVQFAVEPHSQALDGESLLAIGGVETVATAATAHPRVDAQPRIMDIGGIAVGPRAPGAKPTLIAG